MNRFKQWTATALALTLALALAASISPVLAVPAAEPFADFRIDAADMDVPDRTFSIDLYRRDENGSFLPADDADSVSCKVNRVTADAMFYIRPNAGGVRVTVDYLTDVNGDGLYELLDGGDQPVWDVLDPLDGLVRGGDASLADGQTYVLSAETLSQRFAETAQARAKDLGLDAGLQASPLCRVTLRRMDAADGQEYEQLYYLEVCGQILAPPDVSSDLWYYSAVEYSLTQGWFAGLEDSRFGPDEPLSRAQLAQVLWTAAGSPVLWTADGAQTSEFTDVFPTDWFCLAASWCGEMGLLSGYEDGSFLPDALLTREQLASVLHRYAGRTSPSLTDDPAQYSDMDSVSPWAYDSVRWATSCGLLHVSDSSLRPGDAVTRAELAFALYTLQLHVDQP